MQVYSIWSEWDIGLSEDTYFDSVEAALKFLHTMDEDMFGGVGDTIEEIVANCMEEGLIHIELADLTIYSVDDIE